MDIRNTVESHLGGFEDLARKIPGYGGYKEKELRREADSLLRQHMAREFETQWTRMNDVKSQMLIGPAMSQLDEMGKASRKLQTLIDKIKGAAQGYAGFFDAVKVKEDQLDDLYRFDNEMLAQVEGLKAAVDQVQTALDSEENVAPAVRGLNQLISDLLIQFDKRKDVMLGLV